MVCGPVETCAGKRERWQCVLQQRVLNDVDKNAVNLSCVFVLLFREAGRSAAASWNCWGSGAVLGTIVETDEIHL